MKISISIPTYNRTNLVIESFIKVLNNNIVDEIVIVDDFSDISIFSELEKPIFNLNNNKIKLYRNEQNLKPFLNKYESVKKCLNNWTILLDSDNIIDNDYIDAISKLELDDKIIYAPELSILERGNFNYQRYTDSLIDINYSIDNLNDHNFHILINTGNYLVNKNEYIFIIDNNFDINNINHKMISESGIDVMFFNYLWIKENHLLKVIKNLKYFHRVHSGSWYLNNKNKDESRKLLEDMYKKM